MTFDIVISGVSIINQFTECLSVCVPGDGEPELALALANRSAALLSLGEHKAALDDIEEALEKGYPADLQYKLIERQSKCLSATGQINEAIKACHSALEKLEQAHLEPAKAKQVERDVKRLLKELQSSPIAKSSPTDHHGNRLKLLAPESDPSLWPFAEATCCLDLFQ